MNVCPIPLDKIGKTDFDPLLGKKFALSETSDDAPIAELTLEDSLVGGPEEPGRRQAFLLIFSGPADLNLPQRIYTLSNPDFGSLSLFLIPIQPDEKGSRYQAIFN